MKIAKLILRSVLQGAKLRKMMLTKQHFQKPFLSHRRSQTYISKRQLLTCLKQLDKNLLIRFHLLVLCRPTFYIKKLLIEDQEGALYNIYKKTAIISFANDSHNRLKCRYPKRCSSSTCCKNIDKHPEDK